MKGISADQACDALRQGHRVGNRGWPGHRSIAAGDMHEVSPGVLRSVAEPGHAEDWYVLPDEPLRVSGDGTAGRPFVLDNPEALDVLARFGA